MALSKESIIPRPGDGLDREACVYYTAFYGLSGTKGNKRWENKEDSPDVSRVSLINKVHPYIKSLSVTSIVLDLGAGRQIFEREYEDIYGKPKCQIITMDIATISADHLLAQGYTHIQASGRQMPFCDEQFDIVISNMAFDFMLPEASTELYRVTKNGALVFLNLHHPSLLNYDIDDKLAQVSRKIRNEYKFRKKSDEKLELKRAVFLHHKHLRDNKILFETEDQIRRFFQEGGFYLQSVDVKSDLRDKWWKVDLVKRSSQEKKAINPNGTIFTF